MGAHFYYIFIVAVIINIHFYPGVYLNTIYSLLDNILVYALKTTVYIDIYTVYTVCNFLPSCAER